MQTRLSQAPSGRPLARLATVVALIAGAIAAFRWRRRSESARDGRTVWALLIPVVVGASFWFFAVPHPRFGTGPLWFAAALTSALWFSTLDDDNASRRLKMRRLGFSLAVVSLGKRSRPLEIFGRAPRKVCRDFRLIRGNDLYKFVLAHRLKRVIEFSLVTECRPRFVRERFPAQATRAVSRINLGLVRQRKDLVME